MPHDLYPESAVFTEAMLEICSSTQILFYHKQLESRLPYITGQLITGYFGETAQTSLCFSI